MLEYAPIPEKKSKSTDFITELKAANKNAYKISNVQTRIDKIRAAYSKAVTMYEGETHMFLPAYMFLPNIPSHFYSFDGQLYFHQQPVRSASHFFKSLNCATTSSGIAEREIMRCIHNMIRGASTSLGSTLNHYQAHFCADALSIFNDFYRYFKLFEGNLCFFPLNLMSSNTPSLYLLTNKNWEELFKINNLPVPPKSFAQKLLKQIRTELRYTPGNFRISNTVASNPLRITFLNAQSKYIRFEYDSQMESFITVQEPTGSIHSSLLQKSSSTLPSRRTFNKLTSKTLFSWTSGDFSLINKLALLCANIASEETLTKSLFVVTGSHYAAEIIEHIFAKRLQKNLPLDYSLKNLVTPDGLLRLFSNLLSRDKVILISDCTPLQNEDDIKIFKKLLDGKTVFISDKFFGKITFKNTCPIICFPKSHEELVSLTNLYPCQLLNFPDVRLGTPTFALNTIRCLPQTLALYGLKLLADKHNKTSTTHPPKAPVVVAHDNVLNEFLHSCCCIQEGTFIYGDELYQAYVKFFVKFYGRKPLKQTQFSTQLKATGKFEYKRPHVSRDVPNKWAFMDLTLKPDFADILSTHTMTAEENAFLSSSKKSTNLFLPNSGIKKTAS